MGRRTAKNRAENAPKPVQKIELSEKNRKLRIIACVLFLVIGISSLIYAFMNFLAPEKGWNRITSNVAGGSEIVFQYNFGSGGPTSAAEKRTVCSLYDDALAKTYRLFNENESFEGVINICEINRSPNTTLEIDSLLYEVFSTFSGTRLLYLQPIYSRYSNVFYCGDDSELSDFDPQLNPDIKSEFERTASYALDEGSVELQLLGENKVRLYVSEEYLKYAADEGLTDLIGLSYLKNAFVVDHIAEVMKSKGFTKCTISSFDGYTRNPDSEKYSFNIFDRSENTVFQAALMNYSGPMSIVFMRNYPLNSLDDIRFYELKNGEIRTPYIDFYGIPKSSVNNLVCFSSGSSCADIAVKASEIFIADVFDKTKTEKLAAEGIYSVYCENFKIVCNSDDVTFSQFYSADDAEYRE